MASSNVLANSSYIPRTQREREEKAECSLVSASGHTHYQISSSSHLTLAVHQTNILYILYVTIGNTATVLM